MSKIPNPEGLKVKIGDKVKIDTGQWAGYIGEIVSFVENGKNWIKTVKVIKEDGKVEFVEVTAVVVTAVQLLDDLSKTNVFKKFVSWIKNLFKKKKNKNKAQK
jgi:hypothetical protein